MKSEEVKKMREKFGLDRNEFAQIFGFSSYNSVSNIELGLRNPSKLLIIILKTLNTLPKSRVDEIIELMKKHSLNKK